MKKALLEIVKDILSSMDSEDVNSISDSVEALQVAKIVEETFYDIIATRNVPEHSSLSLWRFLSLSILALVTTTPLLMTRVQAQNFASLTTLFPLTTLPLMTTMS